MKKISLKGKLMLSYLFVGMVPMLAMGIYSYQKSSNSLRQESIRRLVAVREVKGEAVKRYFEGIRDQIITFSDSTMIRDAMTGFAKSFVTFRSENELSSADMIFYKSKLKEYYNNEFAAKYTNENESDIDANALLSQLSPDEIALQYHYISSNPNPLGSKEGLDRASDKSKYSSLHKKYHPVVRSYLQKFGYYDIFLVDINSGNIVYSVFKELDYGTSLLTGPYSNTNFAEAFKKAKNLSQADEFILVDYKKYTPSFEAPASFIASPIFDGGKKVGVAIFQMPIDRLNAIMGERAGMGETGETYLVGLEGLMRSDSFLSNETHNVVSSFKDSEKGSISSAPFMSVKTGSTDAVVDINYLGQEVISAYRPIEILGLKWALIAEIGTKEAFAPVASMANAMLIMLVLSIFGILFLAFYASKSLVSGLNSKIMVVADRLFGCAENVGQASDNILVSSTQLSEAATEQAASLQETVASIDEISSMIQRNADAAEGSTQVSKKSNDVAARGKETVELMKASIGEISEGNQEIAREMEKSNEEISKIVEVISEIGEKTKVINDIVFQTKLLSFNASVEAARAGEHGKGFAVVAEEVGNLASMSGKAALEITEMLDKSTKQVSEIVEGTKKKVDRMVSDSKEKVEVGTKTAQKCGEALDEILHNVSSVNEMVREIASASSEQSTGVREVTKAMQQLDQTTHQNTSVANRSSNMANELKSHADELNLSITALKAIVGQDGEPASSPKDQGGGGNNAVSLAGYREKHISNQAQYQESHTGKKVVGMSATLPDSNDPRFEDL